MSQSWRDRVLAEFAPQVARLTLVADPDELLAEQGMQQAIRSKGYDIVEYEDPVAFRYLYESQYRSRWDQGDDIELVVVIREPSARFDELPFDLLQIGRQLHFSISSLFPGLTYNEVIALDRSDFDKLFQAQKTFDPGVMGENATRDFILRHVFNIAPEMIKDEAALLSILLRHHLAGRRLPEVLANRLVQLLQDRESYRDWPLWELITNQESFFEFLQERWPAYLDSLAAASEGQMRDAAVEYALRWDGPLQLPFGHPDVRTLIDNLFLEGKLTVVTHPLAEKLRSLWVSVGVRYDAQSDRISRLEQLIAHLKGTVPAINDQYKAWLSFTPNWAEAILLYRQVSSSKNPANVQFLTLQETIDERFLDWMKDRFKTLASLPPRPPVMVHHIPRFLAAKKDKQPKIALIVVDGMTYDQWLIMRPIMQKQLPDLQFHEQAAFAWVPTLTSVSRQAIFAGQLPLFFPDSISRTNKEPALWTKFWENNGLPATAVGYEKTLRAEPDLKKVDLLLSRPKLQVLGLVVDQVDQMIHGMKLGMSGMHQQVRLWAEQGFLAKLLHQLEQANYHVYLTSDHGNIEAKGIGSPGEASLVQVRGQRARIYPNATLRAKVHGEYPEAIAWSTDGLPPDYLSLLAPERGAFVKEGNTIVSHGGLTLEEVVVPLIETEWRKT